MNSIDTQIPDSLHCTMPDSLAGGWFGNATAGAAADSITADAVFGTSSRLAEIPYLSELDEQLVTTWAEYNPSALVDNIVFKLSAIACFIAFCLLVYLFRGQILGIFNVFRGTGQTEKMLGQQSRIFDIFLGWTIALGLLVLGMTAVKFSEIFVGGHIVKMVPEWASLVMVPAAWAAWSLIFGYKFILLKMAGGVTLSTAFTSKLFFLKKIIFAVATVLLTPVFLVFVLSHGTGADLLALMVLVIITGMTVFLITRTFILFMRQNFSISLWFLYLCAVEIFPASLIWIVAGRIL